MLITLTAIPPSARIVAMSDPMLRVAAHIALLNLRAEYVFGRITIEEFERRIEPLLLKAEPHLRPADHGQDG